MKVFVLAAGYATRMYPLTRDRPKPLLEVGGRPILDHILDRLRGLERLCEVIVIGNHRFNAHFMRWLEGVEFDVPIHLLDDGSTNEDDKLGAIGDIAFALERHPVAGEPWLVVAGDNLLRFDLSALQQRFEAVGRSMLILRGVDHDGGPTRYNEVEVDDEGGVLRFREKPPDATSGLSALALYFFRPEVADRVREYLREGNNPDAPGYFIEWLSAREALASAPLPGEWFDIGSLETLAEARARFGERCEDADRHC